MSGRNLTILSLLLLVASGAVYVPSLSGEYVYDDQRFVRENAAVQEGAGVLSYFTDPGTQTADESWTGLYRPLRTISFRLTALLAEGPGAQRIVNLLLHLLNVLLVWQLLRELLGRERGLAALVGALAFSLHPMGSEAVAWISSRGDLLAMTGILGAILFHRRGRRLAAAAAFALGLLAKESAIVTPVLAVIVDGLEGGREKIRARWRDYAVLATVALAFVAVRFAVLGPTGFGQGEVAPENPVERASTVLAGVFYYIRTTLFPVGLTFELRIATGADARLAAMAGLGLATLLLGGAFVFRHRMPRVSAAVFWFFAALIPVTVLQFWFPLKIAVANRFAYPALVAIGLLLALLAARGRIAAVIAGLVVLAFVPLSAARAQVWSTPEKLWTDVITKDPENAVALFDLGRLALDAGDPERAREHLVASVQIDPRHPQVHALIGETFEMLIQAEPPESEKRAAYMAEAFNAYNAAVRMWEAGVREDEFLYGTTLVNASYMAGVVNQPRLLKEHAHNLVTNRPPVVGTGPLRRRLVHRMIRISQYLEMSGAPELGGRVRAAAEALEGAER